MRLERVEIAGFRGLKRLSLTFDELTTLIGENTWGKSSLLDALSLVLPTDGQLHQFELRDFHVDHLASQPQSQHIQIVLKFKAVFEKEIYSGRYRKIRPIWVEDDNSDHHIIYRITASRNQNKIETSYCFLNLDGEKLSLHHSEKLAQELMVLHPVIRLRDARRLSRTNEQDRLSNDRLEKRINNTSRRFLSNPGHMNKGEIRSSFESMRELIDHYFSFQSNNRYDPKKPRDGLYHTTSALGPKAIQQVASDAKDKQTRLLLLTLLNAFLHAKGPHELRRCARPILIIEDPESRLHPTHLARAWALLQALPMQKLLTTNSAVLLGAVPLSSIKRLVRHSNKTTATSIPQTLLSRDELRRVGFHIRFHRSSALFARCWLLVEGETEVWLFNELAKLCGYDLASAGVQIIEFAQSGLKSLVKVAQSFGIDWHVVTDGDAAGKKYSTAVRSLLKGDQEQHRLTELPAKDIEHYLYLNGFEPFFRELIKVPIDHPIPPKKVIVRVLKKYAKPDLALAIVSHCEMNGPETIPLLLRWTLRRVISMANGNT